MNYYDEWIEVLELQFVGGRRLVLFQCMCFDVYDQKRGFKIDEYGFVSVDLRWYLKMSQQFILARQALQLFYAIVHSNKGWKIVQKVQPRDSFENLEKMDDDLEDLDNSTQVKWKRTPYGLELCHAFLYNINLFMVMILYSIYVNIYLMHLVFNVTFILLY